MNPIEKIRSKIEKSQEDFETKTNSANEGKIDSKVETTITSKPEEKFEVETNPNTTGVETEVDTNAVEVKTEAETKSNSTENKAPERKTVCISKVGSDHIFANKNNHDFAFKLLNMKIVIDGCGSGKHSEVGTKLFAQLFARKTKEYFDRNESITEENFIDVVDSVFYKMLELCDDTSFIFQNYCFTILVCFEMDEEFVVYSCGDGYIIKENEEGIAFDVLDDGEYPCYYIYNFITDKSALLEYKDGVDFKVFRFSKSDYCNVGVSTDGLRFYENLLDVEKNKLMKFLHEGKGPQIEVLINRNSQKFHDDISICF